MANFCASSGASSPPAIKNGPPNPSTAIDLQTVTLSTGLAGTPVIAAMLSGLVPRDLVLRCHPRSWFYFLPWGHERMTVFSRRFHWKSRVIAGTTFSTVSWCHLGNHAGAPGSQPFHSFTFHLSHRSRCDRKGRLATGDRSERVLTMDSERRTGRFF